MLNNVEIRPNFLTFICHFDFVFVFVFLIFKMFDQPNFGMFF